jgi:hemolysin activation/secretion protein
MSIGSHAHFKLAVVVGFFSLWAGVLHAADLPLDPALRLQDDLRRAERAMPQTAPLPAPVPAEIVALPEGPVMKGQIFLQEVLFSPSQLLSEKQLGDVVRPYIGRDVGSDELNALLRDIQALYLAVGVQSAVPVVPQQNLQSGVVKILLVEGTLGQVKWVGKSAADPQWLAKWFDLPLGEVIRPGVLQERLNLFNASSDYTADAQYVPGQSFGTSDLEVATPELANTQYWAMGELPQVGSGRTLGNSLIMGFRHYPLSSMGGRVDGMAIQGPHSTSLSLAGGLPLGHQGWRVGANASVSRSRTRLPSTDAAVGSLLIEGQSSVVSFELIKHLSDQIGQMWKLSGGLSQVHSASETSGVTLTDRSVQRATLAASTDWVVDPASGPERATFRGTANVAKGPISRFAYAEVFSSAAYRLAGPQGPVLRANGQMRFFDINPPDVSDVWLAGGGSTVRGFDPGAVFGQSGYALQLALYQPLPWKAVDAPEAFVFVDQARAVKDELANRIASAGMGLQFQLDRRWALETVLTHQTQGFQGARTRVLMRASASW